MSAPGPGCHRGVPFEEYHSWPYANASRLKLFHRRTPAHARYDMTHPSGPSAALALGAATHQLILEGPEVFKAQNLIVPKLDKRTRDGKAAWAAFELEANGRTLLLESEHARALGMISAIWAHPDASSILSGSGAGGKLNEVSLVWDEDGVRCKARIDALRMIGAHPYAVDLKTTEDASREAFSKQLANLDYHLQAGFYARGLRSCFHLDHFFSFVCVESSPPYEVRCWKLDPEDADLGERVAVELLMRWAECERTGLWPGYPLGLEMISLPAWARKET